MKSLFCATAALALCAAAASADEVKLGVLFGFTGPIESLAPAMAAGAGLAIKEVSDSGKFLDGTTVSAVKADSTCIDAAAATAAAERMITTDGVRGIIGADCSGVTAAVLANVAVPNGMVMISPSATSPGLSEADDHGLFFRTAPSDARQGQVMSDIIIAHGLKSVAVTYTNNDYGKGLADSFAAAYKAAGGTITLSAPHEDNKADYSAEVASLAAAGGDALVVAGYVDKGGQGIIRAALDTGAFDKFVLPDGMIGTELTTAFGDELDGSFGQLPGSDGKGADMMKDLATAAGFDSASPYAGESYDAAALILLAMEAAKSTDPQVYKDKIMDVANAPGEKIMPGELAKGLEILAEGGDIDYQGATGVDMIGSGEAAGSYREIAIKDGKITTVGYH